MIRVYVLTDCACLQAASKRLTLDGFLSLAAGGLDGPNGKGSKRSSSPVISKRRPLARVVSTRAVSKVPMAPVVLLY